MSNQYYQRQTECNPGELADGLAIEAEFDSIQRAFDKLPVPHRDGGGFEGAVKVGTATSDEDAVPKAQLTEALGAVLSKSGNLAGLTDKPTARSNMGLGDAATKNIGVEAGSVAAGDHKHFYMFTIGGDANTFYPVLLSGDVLRDGIAINRDVHLDGTWMGSLRLRIAGTGGAWGGDVACLDYRFTQFWGGNNTSGCLADVAASSVSDGLYLWLRGGRTYLVNGAGVSIDVYLSGRTEANGAVYSPKASGPLSGSYTACSLDGTQLFRGAPGNNKPYWHGENLPYETGTFTPTIVGAASAGAAEYSARSGRYTRIGNRVKVVIQIAWSGHTGTGVQRLSGLPFACSPNAQVCPGVIVALGVAGLSNVASCHTHSTATHIIMSNNVGGVKTDIDVSSAGQVWISLEYEI